MRIIKDAATSKCPHCGKQYVTQMGYCVSCKKKVKKEQANKCPSCGTASVTANSEGTYSCDNCGWNGTKDQLLEANKSTDLENKIMAKLKSFKDFIKIDDLKIDFLTDYDTIMPIVHALEKKGKITIMGNEIKIKESTKKEANRTVDIGWGELVSIGRDSNGNKVAKFKSNKGKSFSIQTNNNLPILHRVSQTSDIEGKEDIKAIEKEVLAYIKKHGTTAQKTMLPEARTPTEITQIVQGGSDWYLKPIDVTHFAMSLDGKKWTTAYHIGQFQGEEPFYSEVQAWLRGTMDISGEMYEAIKITEVITGQFGPAGFLSKDTYESLYAKYPRDLDSIMMDVNMELLDLSDSGKPISKKLNKLSDIRVDVNENRGGKLSVEFPYGVHKDKQLVDLYTKLVKKALGDVKESMKIIEVDITKMIKDLAGDFGKDNESQMKGVQLLKGLATSDDPKANAFMKKLDTATTKISNEMTKSEGKRFDTQIVESEELRFNLKD